MKKVFITGTESFIGTAIIARCDAVGIEVCGIDLAPSSRRGCAQADIRSPEIGSHIPEGVDAIIHLAALSRDPDCRGKAYACFDANVMGTLNLLDAAHERGVRQFIFASTEWVYDALGPAVIATGETPLNPLELTSEYALSKLVSEANLRQRYAQDGMNTTLLRLGIIYGPRPQPASAVESITRTVGTQPVIEVGSLKTGRAFIHVSDIAAAIVASVGLEGMQTLNLQGERIVTLGDIIATAKKIMGVNPAVSEKDSANVSLRRVEGETARRVLGWRPAMSLEEGIVSLLPALGLACAE